MNKEELIQFLKENLKVEIWCDYDGCDSRQVNVSLYLGDEKISIICNCERCRDFFFFFFF